MNSNDLHPTIIKFFRILTEQTDCTPELFLMAATKHSHDGACSIQRVLTKIENRAAGSIDGCVNWYYSSAAGIGHSDFWADTDRKVRTFWNDY